ncbi:phosphotransferase [Microbacterium sp. DT81.1]|uniref:phosphotransferase n=1 Tax=Microbacterium sp. DT81.1 TaxID=3393413 RepID=UPI003CF45D81
MSIPAEAVAAPAVVQTLAGRDGLAPVWRNDYGGLTFRAGSRYIKWCPHNLETSLADEATRLAWAAPYTPVPRMIEYGADADAEWLVTEALPGESAVAPRWLADPATAVRAIGEGLRALHEALPVGECPFVWDVPSRIANAAARGIQLPARFADAPAIERAVVCHADACSPNTLIGDDGRWTAHVDLGQLGVADRWADIAVASMSTEWNYGPGWHDALIAAYGVEPDRQRLAFYRDLWNAT